MFSRARSSYETTQNITDTLPCVTLWTLQENEGKESSRVQIHSPLSLVANSSNLGFNMVFLNWNDLPMSGTLECDNYHCITMVTRMVDSQIRTSLSCWWWCSGNLRKLLSDIQRLEDGKKHVTWETWKMSFLQIHLKDLSTTITSTSVERSTLNLRNITSQFNISLVLRFGQFMDWVFDATFIIFKPDSLLCMLMVDVEYVVESHWCALWTSY